MATLAFLIYLQPDLGTALSICLIGGVFLFIAGLPLRHLALVGAGGAAALGLGLLTRPYQWERIQTFLNPDADPLGAGFQVKQSLLAIGSGGLTGLNLGASRQKLFYLPEPHTDFIFSIIGEELGLLGTALVLVAFGLLLWRGVVSSLRAPCLFGKYLAAGITFCIVMQALENMAIALRMIPTTGITLPFLSFGGSSLVVTMLSMGILLNISQHAR
jgi:cell division protein FtsW